MGERQQEHQRLVGRPPAVASVDPDGDRRSRNWSGVTMTSGSRGQAGQWILVRGTVVSQTLTLTGRRMRPPDCHLHLSICHLELTFPLPRTSEWGKVRPDSQVAFALPQDVDRERFQGCSAEVRCSPWRRSTRSKGPKPSASRTDAARSKSNRRPAPHSRKRPLAC